MNLIIDVGNTRVKVALFEGDSLFFQNYFEKERLVEEIKNLHQKYSISHTIISSVALISEKEVLKIKKITSKLVVLTADTYVPFKNLYSTPKTLGVDRIAIAAAAVTKFQGKNVLTIDAGTCITYDFVNSNQEYLGGAITSGVMMRYKSLHHFTDNLPLLKPEHPKNVIGNTTNSSIHSGVVNGVLAEINSIIIQYKEQYKELTVVLTGGDTNFLAERLKNSIFANPNFVLEGLNNILIYNSKND